MRQRIHLCLVVAFVLASLPAHAGEAMVRVGHNKLDPSDLKVTAGTTVVFHNMDEMPGGHSIVADDGSFQSPALAKDQSWSHTFQAGRPLLLDQGAPFGEGHHRRRVKRTRPPQRRCAPSDPPLRALAG